MGLGYAHELEKLPMNELFQIFKYKKTNSLRCGELFLLGLKV